MDNSERLQGLKNLKLERRESGSFFKTADECMVWIDNVAPLLKYDEDHYKDFLGHASIVRITHLSAQTIMPHLNSMVGIVNQAIIELENNIKAPVSSKHIGIKKIWHESFWGKVLVSVVAGIILFFFGYLLNKFIF